MAAVVCVFPMVTPVRVASEVCLIVAFNLTALLYAGYGYRVSRSLKLNAKNTNLYRRDSTSRPLRVCFYLLFGQLNTQYCLRGFSAAFQTSDQLGRTSKLARDHNGYRVSHSLKLDRKNI